jgi:hypothetical protein
MPVILFLRLVHLANIRTRAHFSDVNLVTVIAFPRLVYLAMQRTDDTSHTRDLLCPIIKESWERSNKSRHAESGSKRTAVPLQAWSVPGGSGKLRFPDFMTTAQDGGKVVSVTRRQ